MSARLLVRGHARGVFETRIAELAADPDGHGLDAEEAAAYQLADRCYSAGWLTVPDDADDRETLWALFNEIANCEDDDAEDRNGDPEMRRFARATRDGMTTLAYKIARAGSPSRQASGEEGDGGDGGVHLRRLQLPEGGDE